MVRRKLAILYIYRDEWTKFTVYANFWFGNLNFHGYEVLRDETESSMFNSLFTHEIHISKSNIPELCIALKLKTTSQDELFIKLRERFSGKNGLYKLTDFLKDHGIKCREYIHDNRGE